MSLNNKSTVIPSEKLSLILDPTSKPCLSIYIPKVSKTFLKEDRKNLFLALAKQAEEILLRDHEPAVAHLLIEKLWSSNPYSELDRYESALGFFHHQTLTGLLPLNGEVDPKIVVADSFHIKPVLGWLQETPPYYLLTLSSNEIKVYQGDAWDLRFIKSVVDERFFHSTKKKASKAQVKEFFHKAETEILELTKNDSRAIVIAGVDWVQALYQKVSKNKNLIPSNIRGDVHRLKMSALKNATAMVLHELFQRAKRKLIFEYELARNKGKMLSDLQEISKAAIQGRVKKMLIARDQVIWGEIKPKTGDLRLHYRQMNSRDDDVLDNLAETVLARGGSVLCVPRHEIPGQGVALAILN